MATPKNPKLVQLSVWQPRWLVEWLTREAQRQEKPRSYVLSAVLKKAANGSLR